MKLANIFPMLLAAVMLFIGNVTVAGAQGDGPPSQPSGFYGSATVDGANVPDGTAVTAWINGTQQASAVTQSHEGNSVYSIAVPNGNDGDTITFQVGGVDADQTGTWQLGGNVNLPLTVTSTTQPTATPQPPEPTATPPAPEPTATATPTGPNGTLNIRGYIDGRSQLVIKGDTAYWHHDQYAAPGRFAANEPTYFDGTAWDPTWPDVPNAGNRDCDCDTLDKYEGVPYLKEEAQTVSLNLIQARGSVAILQQPDASNDYTLIIEFDDVTPNGAEWYEISLGYAVGDSNAGESNVEIPIVSGGDLSVDWTGVTFPETSIAGQDVLADAIIKTWTVSDTTNLGAGWHVTIMADDHLRGEQDPDNLVINVGTSHDFKVACLDSEVAPAPGANVAGGLPTCPTGAQAIPNANLGEAPLTMLSAAQYDGRGAYNFTPRFQLLVPGTTVIDVYRNNIFVDVIAGP